MDIVARLARIELLLEQLAGRTMEKTWYTVEEFAVLTDREPFTVREWCRRQRINAAKSSSKCGPYAKYVISHQEYLRYIQEGLLPVHGPRGYVSRPYHNRREDESDLGRDGEAPGANPVPKTPKNSPKGPPAARQREWPLK
jgi:hypothetical protein